MSSSFARGAVHKSLLIGATASLICSASIGLTDDGAKPHTPDPLPTLKRIFANWKARADRVKSFHFTWDTQVGYPKGSLDPLWVPNHGARKSLLRAAKYRFDQNQFWAEGDNHFRVEAFILSVVGNLKPRLVSTFDGRNNRVLLSPGGAQSHLRGTIRDLDPDDVQYFAQRGPRALARALATHERFRELDLHEYRPLLLALRPFEPVLHWSIDNCAVAQGAKKGGLVKLERRDASGLLAEVCYVDPARDDVIVGGEMWLTLQSGRTVKSVSLAIQY